MFSKDNSIISILDGSETALLSPNRTLSPMAIIANYAANYNNGLALRNATSTAVHEQCRAMLTKLSLDNIAALSTLETHLCAVSPSGAERYKVIIDTLAVKIAMELGRY